MDTAHNRSAPILVFGTDTAGRHVTQRAREARNHGARRGIGDGLRGATYALPFFDERQRPFIIPKILPWVRSFIAFARRHRELLFDIPDIGCTLDEGDYAPAQIAPLFAGAPQNCRFTDPVFAAAIPRPRHIHRVIVAGSRSLKNADQIGGYLARLIKPEHGSLEIVHGDADGVDAIAGIWASSCHLTVTPMPALWDVFQGPHVVRQVGRSGREYNRLAGYDRNARLAAYGTRLIALWDGHSRGTQQMVLCARAAGLPVLVERLGAPLASPRHSG